MSAFDLYSTPSDVCYSAQYFYGLDFNAAFKLQPVYPVIEPSGSIRLWVFDTLTPTDVASALVLPGEHILNLADLLPITGQLENVFKQGLCSIQAHLVVGRWYKMWIGILSRYIIASMVGILPINSMEM